MTFIQKELQNVASIGMVLLFINAHGMTVTYVKNIGDKYKSQI